MNLLLDTNVLIWWLADDETLSGDARRAISNPNNLVLVSAASAWEIAIKTAAEKLNVPDNLETELSSNGFRALPITLAHGEAAGRLPMHHRDPFDRILIAQAMIEGLTLVTRDRRMEPYGVKLIRA